ncbi:MAG: DUF3991 domain-containing protein [Solirubrobacterales bacterium]
MNWINSIQTARMVDIYAYCTYKGYKFVHIGDGNYRIKGMNGFNDIDYCFNHSGAGINGHSIEFLMKSLGMNFREAVEELLEFKAKMPDSVPLGHWELGGWANKTFPHQFEFPRANDDNYELYGYLRLARGLPTDLIDELIEVGLVYQDSYGNCVFPCFDENGTPKGAILTKVKTHHTGYAKNSDTEYGWVLVPEKPAKGVIITESPIEALSLVACYAEKGYRRFYILALNGPFIGAVERFLETYPAIRGIAISMSADGPANAIAETVKARFGAEYKIEELRPKTKKDWNEELCANR